MRIVLIGAGNVGFQLGTALTAAGLKIVQVFSRTTASAKLLAERCNCVYTDSVLEIEPGADLYIVAIRDESVHDILQKLDFIPAVICHTSGTLPLTLFPEEWMHCGVLYPLQTFTKNEQVDFTSVPFCLEFSSSEAKNIISSIPDILGAKSYEINSDQRKHLHLAAVFANNFTNHLFHISKEILEQQKISFSLLESLMKETVRKAITFSPEKVQTGPAKRGDTEIMEAHLKLLEKNPVATQIYRLLSKSILEEYGKNL